MDDFENFLSVCAILDIRCMDRREKSRSILSLSLTMFSLLHIYAHGVDRSARRNEGVVWL